MKKICVLLLALCMSGMLYAQKYVPKIGIGTTFSYDVVATSSGQQIPLSLKIISLNDPMKIRWELTGMGSGSFLIPAKALESGTKMRLEEPTPDIDTKFNDDETIMFISKSVFADMMKNQEFSFSKLKFKVKPTTTPYQINGKDVDVIHAITANSSVEVWILNNPDMPMICKLTGNPGGIDFTLSAIKE
jgi:hypothetical protein